MRPSGRSFLAVLYDQTAHRWVSQRPAERRARAGFRLWVEIATVLISERYAVQHTARDSSARTAAEGGGGGRRGLSLAIAPTIPP